MAKYEIVYGNVDNKKKVIRYGKDAVSAIERLCDQYQWGYSLSLYDADTHGKEWATCKIGRGSYVDYDTIATASKVEAKVNRIIDLDRNWEYTGMNYLGFYEYVKIGKKYYKILYTSMDKRPYIRYNKTTWYLK